MIPPPTTSRPVRGTTAEVAVLDHGSSSSADLSRLRVGMVTPGFPPQLGGVEMVVGQLAASVARTHQVEVLAHRPRRSSLRSETYGANIAVERFADWTGTRQFSVAPGLWRYLRRRPDAFDVLHAHSFHSSAAMAAARMTDQPLVFTPHYHGVGHSRTARALHIGYDRLAARIFDRATSVICVSQAEADLLSRDYPRSAKKIVVIPNGIDTAGIRAATPFRLERPVILAAGRLEKYKQVEITVRAFAHLGPDPILVISGTGPTLPALRELTIELGIENRVRFVGFISTDELQRWYRTAAVTVTLSRHEAFGLVLLEAAVAGARVVASDIPAHRELVATIGDCASLVPLDASVREVAAVIERELTHTNSHARDLEVPSWDDVAGRTVELYRAAQGAT